MAVTLTYGYVKPETGDKGNIFFPALEANIDQLNDHDHNGTNSKKLTASSSDAVSATINAASWIALGDGRFRQLVTVPSGMQVDLCNVSFRDNATGHYIQGLSVEKATATTYYVYINDNSVSLKAVYTT